MGLADAFAAEDRVDVKFTDFYNLILRCTCFDQISRQL